MEFSNSYVKIDLDAILSNFRAVQKKSGVPVMAIVKADAYGHGALTVAKLLEEACAFFGVSSVAEALELYRAGIQKPILLLCHTPVACFPVVVEADIRTSIYCYEEAKALSEEAVRQGKTAFIHISVDTGMSRIGFQVTEASADICAKIAKLPGIVVEGLFSHFATADTKDLEKSRQQSQRFTAFDHMLKERGLEIPMRHMDNSAGVINFDEHYNMVRAGIVLYGLYPSDEVDYSRLEVTPAMSWYTSVGHVKPLEPGREISYGGTFVVDKPMMVATVSVGYADGYRRNLSNRFYVLIRGKRARILGRICMDQLMVDVTDIPGAQVGDEVVLIGTSGDETITAEALGQASESFNYEQICNISRRVTRVYLKDGKETARINYLLG